MTDRRSTIINPTADQLEAGGKVSGTYRGIPFTDQNLWVDEDGELGIGFDCCIRDVGGCWSNRVTITSYTPPELKPWWETCDGDTWIAQRYIDRDTEVIYPAKTLRRVFGQDISTTASVFRRVLIADADTEVVVPKAALDDLRRRHSSNLGTDRVAVRLFLAAVDERGES